MRLTGMVFLTIWACIVPELLNAQALKPSLSVYNEVKDSIVARYNRSDFRGIYQLSDTSFSKKITEQQLVNFLTNNLSTGRVIKSSLYKETENEKHYHLECQARDMIMILDVTPEEKIKSFGFTAYPQVLRPITKVASNNPMMSKMDLVIDSAAKEYFRFPQAASLSIGLIKNGKVFNYHYGEIKKGSKKLPDLNTGYQIASVTKTFTATLLAQAVVDGKVKLTDDIRKYLPGKYSNLQYEGRAITLLDLANHTSGLPSVPDNLAEQLPFDPLDSYANYTRELFSEALHRIRINYAPGSKFNYSNMGMDLLGWIIELASGAAYSDLLKKQVTDPLGMSRTKVQINDTDKNTMAIPYGNNGREVPFWNSAILPGAGGITSTTGDLLKYLENQITERTESVKLTHQPTANSTGLAWGVRTVNNVRDLQHSGGGVGYRSNITFYPELKSGAVILVNNDSDNGIMNHLVIAIQNILKTQLY